MARILTAEQREQLHRRRDGILDRLPPELTDLEEAEEQIEEGFRGLGEATMQAWTESAGTASPPPSCPQCGWSMRHRGLARRTLTTVHGTITYARPRRRCDRCGQESYPQDAALCFGSHGVSWKVAQRVSRLGSLLPSFEMTRQLLLEDYGIELSKHTIERIVQEAGGMMLDGDDAAGAACFAEGGNGVARGRCKQAGMRNWTRRGAEAVLRLRAAQFDGDFGPLWDARLRLAS